MIRKIFNNKRTLFLMLLLLIMVSTTVIYTSYGLFIKSESIKGINVTVGNLKYTLDSGVLDENNHIKIKSGDEINTTITVTSNNKISSKYELYYKVITPDKIPDDFIIGYSSDTANLVKGTIGQDESKSIKISMKNHSEVDTTLEFGVRGGLESNELVLAADENSITNQVTSDDIILAYTYTGTNDPGTFPNKYSGYHVDSVTCNGATAAWDQNSWGLLLSNINATEIKCLVDFRDVGINDSWTFSFKEKEEQFVTPLAGQYKLEVWGAQGGYADSYTGGKGGYTSEIINLLSSQILYVNVGGEGNSFSGYCTVIKGGNSYNGGGGISCQGENYYGSGGGGATHIATSSGVLSSLSSNTQSVLIVAGGGGGSSSGNDNNQSTVGFGGAGGGLTGITGTVGNYPHERAAGTGGSQTSGGTYSDTVTNSKSTPAITSGFGQGCSTKLTYASYLNVSGGGGWYGGGCAVHSGGGGGSGYAKSGSSTIIMKNGTESIPTHDLSGTMIGNTGNGYARITYLGD